MKTGTKTAALAIAVIGAFLVALAWRVSLPEDLQLESGATALERNVAGDVNAAELDASSAAAEPLGERVVADPAGEAIEAATETEAPEVAAKANDAQEKTRVTARIIDEGGAPIQGATLHSLRDDGRPRGGAPSPPSGANGVALLELEDVHLRAYRETVFPMVFGASADRHATAFVTSTPARHATTDLGTIVLGPGGAVRGVAVDPQGAPIGGAVVLAAEPGISGELADLRLIGPTGHITRPRAVAGSDGRFEVTGAPARDLRLWLHAPGRLWTIDRVIQAQPGATVDAGQIVLEPVPEEHRITGLVRLPGGAPAPDTSVWFEDRETRDDGSVIADDAGRFLVVSTGNGDVELVARHAESTFAPSVPRIARAGDSEVVLVLRVPQTIEVSVADPDGAALEGAAVAPFIDVGAPRHPYGRFAPGDDWTRTDTAGRATLVVPARTFCVTASLRGYVGYTLGPFEPTSAPERLEMVIQPEPRIEGRVVAGGAPVPGAQIRIAQRIPNFVPVESGFPIRFFINRYDGVRTDANGEFACPVDEEWTEITVLVESEDYAMGEVELSLEAGKGQSGVEVEVTRGGAIAGAVLPPPGVRPETLVVAASRGDGRPVSTRPDANGKYLLDRLTPGPWRVEGRDREPAREILSVANSPEDKEFRWNVDVVDGETALFDVDMRERGDVQLAGTFLVDGAPVEGWTAELRVLPNEMQREALPIVEVDDTGEFTMVVPAGTYDLRLIGPLPGLVSVEALHRIEILGQRVDWTRDLVMGPLVESVEAGTPRVRLVRGHFREGDREFTILEPDPTGAIDVRVPAGKSSLQHEADGPYGFGWLWLRTVDV